MARKTLLVVVLLVLLQNTECRAWSPWDLLPDSIFPKPTFSCARSCFSSTKPWNTAGCLQDCYTERGNTVVENETEESSSWEIFRSKVSIKAFIGKPRNFLKCTSSCFRGSFGQMSDCIGCLIGGPSELAIATQETTSRSQALTPTASTTTATGRTEAKKSTTEVEQTTTGRWNATTLRAAPTEPAVSPTTQALTTRAEAKKSTTEVEQTTTGGWNASAVTAAPKEPAASPTTQESCTHPLIYTDCAPKCVATCDNPRPSCHKKGCKRGQNCICPSDMVWRDEKNKTCVTSSQCTEFQQIQNESCKFKCANATECVPRSRKEGRVVLSRLPDVCWQCLRPLCKSLTRLASSCIYDAILRFCSETCRDVAPCTYCFDC